jgi:AcrR family transcriptional regulator
LVVAAAALLSERGFEATSPTMVLKRSGVGHGSLYHYFEGKESLALAAVEYLRARMGMVLDLPLGERSVMDLPPGGCLEAPEVGAALDRLFAAREGRALLRLLGDPAAAASAALSAALLEWCMELRVTIYLVLDPDAGAITDAGLTPWESVEELYRTTDPILTAALGRGLLGLPRNSQSLASATMR